MGKTAAARKQDCPEQAWESAEPERNRSPRRPRSSERSLQICEGMIDIAAALFNVSGRELRLAGRTTLGVARVRQIAMYVTHVVLELSMTEVGRGFGRDRTTVLHACHLVEDLRDDDEFDRLVTVTERIALAAFRQDAAA